MPRKSTAFHPQAKNFAESVKRSSRLSFSGMRLNLLALHYEYVQSLDFPVFVQSVCFIICHVPDCPETETGQAELKHFPVFPDWGLHSSLKREKNSSSFVYVQFSTRIPEMRLRHPLNELCNPMLTSTLLRGYTDFIALIVTIGSFRKDNSNGNENVRKAVGL